MRNILRGLAVATLAAGGGCTPGVYKGWADSQIGDILRDRKKQTIGYQAEIEAASTVPDQPSRAAYKTIPTTPIPPVTVSPLEPSKVAIPFEGLGPDVPPAEEANPAGHRSGNPYDRSAMEGHSIDRLKLGPPTPDEIGTQLDLFRAIEYAVQHSRSYQSQMENLYLQTLDVTLQRHLFEPTPFASESLTMSKQFDATDSRYQAALSAISTAGIRQRLPLGGELTAQTVATIVHTIDGVSQDAQPANVALTASIPLLRGFGLVNLEPLINSERQLVYQIRGFETYRRQFAVDIASRYFNLISQQQQLANTRLSYSNLINLTAKTQALYQAGKTYFLDVQRSAQSQLAAEASLITAESAYQTAIDQFKIVIGMPIDVDLAIVPVELDLNIPTAEPSHAMDLATQFRLDLQTARDQIEDSRRNVSNAKNGLLPDLTLTGNYFVNSSRDDATYEFDRRNQIYSAGVRIDLPLDRLAERNVYRASLISLQRSERGYEELRDTIAVAARDALRGIAVAQTNLEIQRIGIELAQSYLDNANEQLKSTATTSNGQGSRDVVDAQQALLVAQNAYAVARSNLQISVLNYLRDTGTLRLDPAAGALGQAMDRAAARQNNPPVDR